MLTVSSREFRINQKKYFDLAENDEQIFIKRGRQTFLLSPVRTGERYNPEIIERVSQARENLAGGKVKKVIHPADI